MALTEDEEFELLSLERAKLSQTPRKTSSPADFLPMEMAKEKQKQTQARAEFAQKNPVMAGLQTTGADIARIPAHFINQLAMNYPRSMMNTFAKGAGDEAFATQSPVAGVLSGGAGMAGGVMSPLNKLAIMKAATPMARIGAGAIAGGLQAPTKDVRNIGERVASAAGGAVIAPVAGAVVDKAIRAGAPAIQKISDVIADKYNSAIKPTTAKISANALEKDTNTRTRAIVKVASNLENTPFIDDGVAVVRPPKTVQEALDATSQTLKQVYNEYTDLASRVGGNATIKLAHSKQGVTAELDAIINNKNLKLVRPEVVKYAQEMRDKLVERGEASIKDAAEIVQTLNAKTASAWSAVAGGKGKLSPEAAGTIGVDELIANNLRKQLDDVISTATGKDYASLKKDYGALRQVEKELARASSRISNRQKAGILDFSDIFSGAQLGASLLRGDVAGAVGGGIGRAVKEVLAYRNNPNKAIEKMFSVASKNYKDIGKTPTTKVFGKEIGTPASSFSRFLKSQRK